MDAMKVIPMRNLETLNIKIKDSFQFLDGPADSGINIVSVL